MAPPPLGDTLVSADRIRTRVQELVLELETQSRRPDFILLGILRGSFMFIADLVRGLHMARLHPRIDFMALASYGSGTESAGRVDLVHRHATPVRNAHVLLVDDILDTGRTLSFARARLLEEGAASVATCVLLDKPARRVVPIEADHVGFTIEDLFVVGYGLDVDGYYRELPYIARLDMA